MKISLHVSLLALALVATPAVAQDLATYNRALSAYNAGDYDRSAQLFYEVDTTATDPELKAKSEYYLASSFQKKGLPFSAFVYFATILKVGKAHPFYLKSVEGLVNVQEQLDDQFLIPSLLNNNYNDDWATLPAEILARINYVIGSISQRNGKLDEAKSFLEAVTAESSVFAKSQYLLGIVAGDPRFPGGPKPEEALKYFEAVLSTRGSNQKDLVDTQQLATLGLGRTHYGLGQFQQATLAYEQIPRFSKYWDQALFENGFARFQNDDFGGGLGSLQGLQAPQFAGAFQPEGFILKSTIYFFSCLYEEAKASLVEFDNLYLPMAEVLKPSVEGEEKELKVFYRLVDDPNSKLPRPIYNWVRANERMLNTFGLLREIDAEKKVLEENQGFRAAKLSGEMITYLDSNRATLEQVAGRLAKNRVVEAYRSIKEFSNQAEIIRFETSKAEKEIAESGVNQQKLLTAQTLYRPKMPGEAWNYWKFQGEFWRDEIGYYQYTLKRGCAQAEK